jgi:hypothetical protein
MAAAGATPVTVSVAFLKVCNPDAGKATEFTVGVPLKTKAD